MEIGIGLWLLFGLASALIANSRGAGGCLWFVVGLLLGPIGLILAIFIAKPSGRCPHCHEAIDPRATRCPKCQGAIGQAVATAQPASIFCTKCGAPMSAGTNFCAKCGTRAM